MKQIYITVDKYYDINSYQKMISALDDNAVEYKEWISTRPPYAWYISIDSSDRPKFIKYDEADRAQRKFLVSRVTPQKSEQVPLLMRRETDRPNKLDKFILNDVWSDISKANHVIFFRYKNQEECARISEVLNTKIYYIGKHQRWKICVGFNPNIAGMMNQDGILMEKNKRQLAEFKKVGELEVEFNYRILKITKISKKYPETLKWVNGKKYPVVVPNGNPAEGQYDTVI